MIEEIAARPKLLRAMSQVQKNKGSCGADYMPVTKLTEILSVYNSELVSKARLGKHLPQPILGVEIPKGNC